MEPEAALTLLHRGVRAPAPRPELCASSAAPHSSRSRLRDLTSFLAYIFLLTAQSSHTFIESSAIAFAGDAAVGQMRSCRLWSSQARRAQENTLALLDLLYF